MQHWCTGGCGLWLVQTKLWWWHHGALDSKTRGCCFNLCSWNFYFLVINSVTCQLQHSHCPHQCACFGEFLFSISQTLHLSAIPLLSHFLSLKKNQKLKICFWKFKITGLLFFTCSLSSVEQWKADFCCCPHVQKFHRIRPTTSSHHPSNLSSSFEAKCTQENLVPHMNVSCHCKLVMHGVQCWCLHLFCGITIFGPALWNDDGSSPSCSPWRDSSTSCPFWFTECWSQQCQNVGHVPSLMSKLSPAQGFFAVTETKEADGPDIFFTLLQSIRSCHWLLPLLEERQHEDWVEVMLGRSKEWLEQSQRSQKRSYHLELRIEAVGACAFW